MKMGDEMMGGMMLGGKRKASKPMMDDSDDLTDAAQDVLDAQKSGDAKALGLALKRVYACCGDDDEEMTSEE